MYQFTQAEVHKLRRKSKEDPRILKWLQEKTALLFQREVQVPKTGIANWTLYYYCSKHSVALEFNIDKPTEHKCPVDGEVFSGEPYDSAWWGHMNYFNMQGAYELGLLYMLTEDRRYADKVKAILLEYATYYPDYEVHGDIPYNHPGRIAAQALDEAVFIRVMACAYDLIEDILTLEEKNFIRDNLLVMSAKFLQEQRTNQLHNHEVIINTAIAIVGIIFEEEELCDFALYKPYGLRYQLEKGVLEDKMWFEGAVSYHFYALQSFFGYEKFARHTKHSQLKHPNYRGMINMILDLLQPDYTFPLLNDASLGNASLNGYNLFEFAYSVFKDENILKILHKIYETTERNNLETFFYGVDELPVTGPFTFKEVHNATGSGMTVMRGSEGRYLLFKHSPFGGEHDHYDRLGLSYLAYNKRVAPDLGTTGYGATLHYDYFKNTGTHNTVVINEENQAPTNCKVYSYQKDKESTYIDAGATWDSTFIMPDSFTIKQWDDECYQGVKMRRKILWLDKYFIEVFTVDEVRDYTIDWVMHVAGERVCQYTEEEITCFSNKKPFRHLHEVTRVQGEKIVRSEWQLEDTHFQVFSLANNSEIYYGLGPDNPSVTNLSYIINRQYGKQAIFVNVLESYQDAPVVKQVEIAVEHDRVQVVIKTEQADRNYTINLA